MMKDTTYNHDALGERLEALPAASNQGVGGICPKHRRRSLAVVAVNFRQIGSCIDRYGFFDM
jgi:hypothetical protein